MATPTMVRTACFMSVISFDINLNHITDRQLLALIWINWSALASRLSCAMSGKGHEDAFPAVRLNSRVGFEIGPLLPMIDGEDF
jgi:hypothetical protein